MGFKSFQDKVSFDFNSRISGIVGPNGCGKSNVVDAIRWVMGEQSARNLRGRNMDEIIFNGSELRKPVGMGEVSLVFSTEDGRVPAKYLNFTEIQVTRRLYRSGDSEYLINKTPCRLLDIAELFMDTGIGTKAYSIVEQGKIGTIIHAKPEERRYLIEEAAGVTKFKSRKQMALKKIEVTKQNLLRIGDMVSELRRQLSSLQKQATKAEKYRECREELKTIELFSAYNNHKALFGNKSKIHEDISGLNDKLDGLIIALEQKELSFESCRISVITDEKQIEKMHEDIFQLKGQLSAVENKIDFQRRELSSLDRRVSKFDEDIQAVRRQIIESENEMNDLKADQQLLVSTMAIASLEFEAESCSLDEMIKTESATVLKLDELRRELFGTLSTISQLKNHCTNAVKRQESIADYFTRYNNDRNVLLTRIDELSRRMHTLSEVKQTCTNDLMNQTKELQRVKSIQDQCKTDLSGKEALLLNIRDSLSSKNSRLDSLKEFEARFDGVNQGVKTILLDDKIKDHFEGIVADIIEVDADGEVALEAVLSEILQYIVCKYESDAIEAISLLNSSKGGRCTFITQNVLSSCESINPPVNAIPISSRIHIKAEWQAMIVPLLCDIYIVDNLSVAMNLGKLYPDLVFVTYQGEIIKSGGIVTGGSSDVVNHGIIHRKREIKDLSREILIIVEEVDGLQKDKDTLNQHISSNETMILNLQNQIHQAEISAVSNERDLTQVIAEINEIEERIKIKEIEVEQLNEEATAISGEIERWTNGINVEDRKKEQLEIEQETTQQELLIIHRELENQRQIITENKVRHASLKERLDANYSAFKKVEQFILELKTRLDSHGLEQVKAVEEEKNLMAEIQSGEEAQKLLINKIKIVEAEYDAIKSQYDIKSSQLLNEDSEIKTMRTVVNGIKESLNDKNLTLSSLSHQLLHLESSVYEKYRVQISSINMVEFERLYDESVNNARQLELNRILDEMGDVNLMAIEEYKELKERFDFLSSQKDDLEESLRTLLKAIQRINRTTRKRFVDTFNLVNAKFKDVFPRLFCGGTAELRLTNEEDLLESGIDIIVQPPGKKLQNVSLLSGGEKALTAVALIFSIFMIKPSPFCLLDEVDAPLDDANINRFNDIVREMSEFAQFIIITHNKATMAVAENLFGVTMEEPGVSKIVSVKLL
jgi:chromosome segregation protein